MNSEDREVLKGYELALDSMNGRLSDLSKCFQTLNDAHINSESRLTRLETVQGSVSDSTKDNSKKLDSLNGKFTVLETTLKTLSKVIMYFLTPAVIIQILLYSYGLINGVH